MSQLIDKERSVSCGRTRCIAHRKLHIGQWQMIDPMVIGRDITSEYVFDNSIHPLSLSISLRVITCRHQQFRVGELDDISSKRCSEPRISVTDYLRRHSMQPKHWVSCTAAGWIILLKRQAFFNGNPKMKSIDMEVQQSVGTGRDLRNACTSKDGFVLWHNSHFVT